MCLLIRNSLLGKTCKAYIGLPEDFNSIAGKNILKGTILSVGFGLKKDEWVLLRVTPFEYEGIQISQVLAVNGSKTGRVFLKEMLEKDFAIANFFFATDGSAFETNNIIENLRRGPEKYDCLVGTLSM